MAPEQGVAWFLCKALDRGLQCVAAAVPRWELNAFDDTEGTCLHFAASHQLPDAALAPQVEMRTIAMIVLMMSIVIIIE